MFWIFQIYHYCHADGKQDTFHCGYGTIFNEYLGTCDHSGAVYCKGGEGYAGPPKPHPHHEPSYHPGHHEPSYHSGESIKKQHGNKTTNQPKKTTVHKKKQNKTEDVVSNSPILKNHQNRTGGTVSFQSNHAKQSQNSVSFQKSPPQISRNVNNSSVKTSTTVSNNGSQNVPKYKFLIPNPSNWLKEMKEIRDNVPPKLPKVKHKIAYKIIPPTIPVDTCDTRTTHYMKRFKNICEHNSQQFAGRCFCCFLTVSILFYPVVFITLMFMYHPFHE